MRFAVLSLFLLGACAPGARVGEAQDAITEGAADAADPGVVFVFSSEGEICTGSVIAPRLVLTAAHCIDPTATYVVGAAAVYDPDHFSATTEPVVDVVTATVSPLYDDSVTPHLHDVAVLAIDSDLGPAVPYHSGAPTSSWDGQTIRLVGYGRTSPTADDYGTRRSVDTVLASYDANELLITNGKQGCPGDSGGPAFMTIDGVETMIGTSSASTADCKTTGYYERIDQNITFLDAQIARSTGAAPVEVPTGTPAKNQVTGGCSMSGPGDARGAVGLLIVALAFVVYRRRYTWTLLRQVSQGQARRSSSNR